MSPPDCSSQEEINRLTFQKKRNFTGKDGFMELKGWILSIGNFSSDTRWVLSALVFLIFGLFPMIMKLNILRTLLKKYQITEENLEIISFLIKKLNLLSLIGFGIVIPFILMFIKAKAFQNTYWIPVIISTIFYSKKSSSMVDPIMKSMGTFYPKES